MPPEEDPGNRATLNYESPAERRPLVQKLALVRRLVFAAGLASLFYGTGDVLRGVRYTDAPTVMAFGGVLIGLSVPSRPAGGNEPARLILPPRRSSVRSTSSLYASITGSVHVSASCRASGDGGTGSSPCMIRMMATARRVRRLSPPSFPPAAACRSGYRCP